MLTDDRPRTEAAAGHLKRDILCGALAPDQPLRLSALARRYGIGHTPLREALSRLAAAGLVVLRRNRGYRVAPVSLCELEDLERARLVVETALLEDAIAHGGLAWESAVVSAHHRLKRTTQALLGEAEASCGRVESPDVRNSSEEEAVGAGQGLRQTPNRFGRVDEWMEAHDAFHAALSDAARSSWLKSFQRQISEQLRRHQQAFLFNPGSGAVREGGLEDGRARRPLEDALALEQHTALMEAVLGRRAGEATALIGAHVQLTLAIHGAAAARRPATGPGHPRRGCDTPRTEDR